jgi:pimeloyl-ACP methyl ester carboxylesterase
MSERATEVLFLPGFDGVAELREPFVAALAAHYPARALGYPNRAMGTLNGYVRHASASVSAQSRPVLVAESFSGLVAARWAAADPHVAGLVLCGAFARAPVPWAALGASMPSMAQFLAAYVMVPTGFVSTDPARRRWSEALGTALRSLDREVIAERLRIIATEDVSGELKALRSPVAIVQFDDDVVIGASARAHLEACCANARVIRVPGPHFAIETRPSESAEAIRGEIARLFA